MIRIMRQQKNRRRSSNEADKPQASDSRSRPTNPAWTSVPARSSWIEEHLIAAVFCLLALLTASSSSLAQTTRPAIGVLSPFIDSESTFLNDLRDGLGELGFRDGRNITIEYRSAEG